LCAPKSRVVKPILSDVRCDGALLEPDGGKVFEERTPALSAAAA